MIQPYQRNTENLKRVILHGDGTYTDVTDVPVIPVEESYFTNDGQMLLNGKIYKRKAKILPDGSNSLAMGHDEAKDIGVTGGISIQMDKSTPVFVPKDAGSVRGISGIGLHQPPLKTNISVAPGYIIRYAEDNSILLDNSFGDTSIQLVVEGENS